MHLHLSRIRSRILDPQESTWPSQSFSLSLSELPTSHPWPLHPEKCGLSLEMEAHLVIAGSQKSVLQEFLIRYMLNHPCSQVHHRQNVPFNAVLTTSFLSFILCLIQLGSTVAFNIIISLNLIAFLGTYIISIGCLLIKRFRHEPLPPARFSLGRWGLPVNLFAFCYSALTLVFSCFPVSVPVDASTANWGPAIWGGVLGIALISYLVQGRKDYKGPVIFVDGVRREGTGLQTA